MNHSDNGNPNAFISLVIIIFVAVVLIWLSLDDYEPYVIEGKVIEKNFDPAGHYRNGYFTKYYHDNEWAIIVLGIDSRHKSARETIAVSQEDWNTLDIGQKYSIDPYGKNK